jgi:myo-inositol-1(or 4)-monophosphatase
MTVAKHVAASEISALALEAARTGATAIRSTLKAGPLDSREKPGDQGLVTNADYASESAIIQLIKARRSDDAILAEESGEHVGTTGVRWVIDPLDGTTNFAHGRDYYAVSVAAEADEQVVAAAICQPASGLWLACGPDGLAASQTRVGVRQCQDPRRALMSFAVSADPRVRRAGYHALAEVAPRVGGLRNLGSTVCDLAAVAMGLLDGFIGFAQAPWDTAAGAALVEAAGGVCRNLVVDGGLPVVVAGNVDLVTAVCALLT